MEAHENPNFIGDDGKPAPSRSNKVADVNSHIESVDEKAPELPPTHSGKPREQWGKGIEFLLSCIAMSVGLGNIWRFPFTALENGGGAFLIPYIIVLVLIGKPIYYLEMLIGQFSSRGSVKVYDLCPIMRGVGVGQVIAIGLITTYYASLMGLTVKYFIASFQSVLPWSVCNPDWEEECFPSNRNSSGMEWPSNETRPRSSAELYFLKDVLHEKNSIEDGIGLPDWQLTLCLLFSWLCIYLIIVKGVRSSGKASYFLAIFPYIVLGILLIRAVTLEGSGNGILFFITPQWDQLINPKVWYAAVTQCFFSLTVCLGNVIMYSSYNKFNHNIYRDVTIVSLMDTMTSLLAGCTIFGILGHLAHELGTEDIASVVKGGTGLAFISYPEAIAKFDTLPQAFSALFFFMLFVLGIGSNVAMTSCVVTSFRDFFPKVKNWKMALFVCVVSALIGLSYVTPGGQFVLNLVDYYAASVIVLVLAIFELFALGWVYGVSRLCKDCDFMIDRNPNIYWRLCWGVVGPVMMTVILIYTFVTYEPITYNDVEYPSSVYAIGWCISAFGILQLPIWGCVAVIRHPGNTIYDKFFGAFKPKKSWGPVDPGLKEKYEKFLDDECKMFDKAGIFHSIRRNLFD